MAIVTDRSSRRASLQFAFFLDNLRLQSIYVGGDFRLSCWQILGDAVADGLDLLVYLLGRRCSPGAGLLPVRHDLVVPVLLGRSHRVLPAIIDLPYMRT